MLQRRLGGSEPRARSRRLTPVAAAVLGTALAATSVMGPSIPAFAQKSAPTGAAPYAHAPATFADIVERVKPAVVSIKVTSGGDEMRTSRFNPGGRSGGATPFPDLPPDHPLNRLFKDLPREYRGSPGRRAPRLRQSQGSGFVISEDGYVVTNNHVVRGGNQITISFDEKENLPAEIVGTDPRTDLALLKIKAKRKFKYVKFATSEGRVGDWVVAVGNPFGLGGTVTVGVLSALSRNIGSGPYDYIQIDAAVNRGNSGGPTFNLNGEVIGVNTAIYSPSGGNVGIAFAVPAVTAAGVIEQLKKSGSVKRGWLGVKIQTITDDIAASLGLSDAQGALISELTPNAPAQAAGLREGDAILTVNNEKVEDSRDLARKIAGFAPGATVAVGIRRGGSNMSISVKLGTFPSNPQMASNAPAEPQKPHVTALKALGLDLVEAGRDGGDAGVVIRDVDPDSDAAQKGLQQGDVIVAVNGQKVEKPADVDRIVRTAESKGRRAVLMTVKTENTQRFVAVLISKAG